jgi:hypothetical protein
MYLDAAIHWRYPIEQMKDGEFFNQRKLLPGFLGLSNAEQAASLVELVVITASTSQGTIDSVADVSTFTCLAITTSPNRGIHQNLKSLSHQCLAS